MKNNILKNIIEKDIIKEIVDKRFLEKDPEATVIIATYEKTELLIKNLNSLQKQTLENFEIIVIDNNEKTDVYSLLRDFQIVYIKLNKNYGISLARNIGTIFARGPIIIFLDDDAIPAKDLVEQHVKAYQKRNIVGLRGKCIPINPGNFYNYLADHYDLGEEIIPYYINLEGNSSFRKDSLIEIGGFNTEFGKAGGHEGLELSNRIMCKYRDKNKLIYYPKAIIYHDYADSFLNYLRKQIRHNENKKLVEKNSFKNFILANEYKLKKNKKIYYSNNIVIKVIISLIKILVKTIVKIYAAEF